LVILGQIKRPAVGEVSGSNEKKLYFERSDWINASITDLK
jgi:hypothetical protein